MAVPTGPLADGLIVPLARIREARPTVQRSVSRTPLLASRTAASVVRASTGVRLADERLYVKAEHLQKTGSFKARGMTWRVFTLSDAQRQAGIITLSAGNAGQAYAWAASALGSRATVVMPAGAVRSKVDACLGYGAEVVLHGTHVGETFAEMERLRDERGLTFCHPFDDPEVIAGHGSLGLELLDDLPDVDVVVVGIGGGGLISGVAAAIRETRPSVRVHGVEPVRSNALSQAWQQGRVVPIQPESVADGLNAPFAGEWTLAMTRRYLEDIVLLDEATILGGLRFAAERMKQVLEPAGAAALAAVLYGRVPLRDGERVAVIASGGNVEIGRLGALLEGAAPFPGADGARGG